MSCPRANYTNRKTSAEKALAFEELPIETIFRTKSANLKKIFSETRKKVLQITKDPAKKLKDIKRRFLFWQMIRLTPVYPRPIQSG